MLGNPGVRDWRDRSVNFNDYLRDVLKTESMDTEAIAKKLSDPQIIRFCHALSGMVTEVGELEDIKKKFLFYGKELDLPHIKEELGDFLWYFGVLCDTFGFCLDEMLETNIAKLKARYPDGWEKDRSLNRDLDKEDEILGKE